MNEWHESNRACWNSWADWWREKADQRGIWNKCHRDPGLALAEEEMHFLRNSKDKDICVLGSGDNEVVFALAGMGAIVTFVDISEKQLEIAQERAAILGLDISFLRADIADLSSLPDNRFDIVYTGGHMSVWLSDITKCYNEAVRILRPDGLFIVNDYHPARRMWHESDGPGPRHRYLDRGPYKYKTKEGLSQIEFHWTTADHIQPVIDAGCIALKVDEYKEGKEEEDYAVSVPPALPLYLLIVGQKK